jgi:hypothetical protein
VVTLAEINKSLLTFLISAIFFLVIYILARVASVWLPYWVEKQRYSYMIEKKKRDEEILKRL